MDVKEAVRIAKLYIADLFKEEGIQNIGLEEVEENEDAGLWIVTIGFARDWDQPGALFSSIGTPTRRTYKRVRINSSDGQVVSVHNREAKV